MQQRLQLTSSKQKRFFQKVRMASNLSWEELGVLSSVSGRTIADWSKAKFTASEVVYKKLSQLFKIPIPRGARLERYWYIKKYAHRGALARQKLHGLLGDRETRRRGGLESQRRRRLYPEKYRLLGCTVRKEIKRAHKAAKLAELVGVLLGDGGITSNQVRITLNRKTEKEYAQFLTHLVFDLFQERPSITKRSNVVNLTLTGVAYVEYFEQLGLHRGNKVKNQVDIPTWILRNARYAKACVRGLVDTDGGVYTHNHKVRGKRYYNLGLCFVNHSLPLVNAVASVLTHYHLDPKIVKERKIYLYKLQAVKRYFQIVGSNNSKNLERFREYLKISNR